MPPPAPFARARLRTRNVDQSRRAQRNTIVTVVADDQFDLFFALGDQPGAIVAFGEVYIRVLDESP